jgi:hypothetical protein
VDDVIRKSSRTAAERDNFVMDRSEEIRRGRDALRAQWLLRRVPTWARYVGETIAGEWNGNVRKPIATTAFVDRLQASAADEHLHQTNPIQVQFSQRT